MLVYALLTVSAFEACLSWKCLFISH